MDGRTAGQWKKIDGKYAVWGGGGVRSSSLKYEDKAELLADFPNCGAVSP